MKPTRPNTWASNACGGIDSGCTAAWIREWRLQILGREACVLGRAGKHARAKLFAVVKGNDTIQPLCDGT
jgi:hypothetical protein